MYKFHHTLVRNRLMDLGFIGYSFTWHRGNEKTNRIAERFDRAYASVDWMQIHPHSEV